MAEPEKPAHEFMEPTWLSRLAVATGRLEAAYEDAHAVIQSAIDRGDFVAGTQPEQVMDTNGRYLLLDALTAIVEARTALANANR